MILHFSHQFCYLDLFDPLWNGKIHICLWDSQLFARQRNVESQEFTCNSGICRVLYTNIPIVIFPLFSIPLLCICPPLALIYSQPPPISDLLPASILPNLLWHLFLFLTLLLDTSEGGQWTHRSLSLFQYPSARLAPGRSNNRNTPGLTPRTEMLCQFGE